MSYLLETGGCPHPRRILAISFKRDAARNLRERVAMRTGETLGRRFDSLTFDAFAKGIVDQFLPAIPDPYRPTADYDVETRIKPESIEEALLQLSPPSHIGSARDLRALSPKKFFDFHVHRAPLFSEPQNLHQWAAKDLWRWMLRGGPRSALTFRMITRLAGELQELGADLDDPQEQGARVRRRVLRRARG